MTIHEASRTLLKSPPELWAECSDATSLSRHLDQFGEIKITRLEPETAVAWEGENVSGTVRLEPSGWGTRVILTAEEVDPVIAAESAADPEPVPVPEPLVEAEPAVKPKPAVEPDPEPLVTDEPVAQPPLKLSQPQPEPEPKLGFFARLFGRKQLSWPQVEPVAEPRTLEPEPVVADEPSAAIEPEPEPVVAEKPSTAIEPEPEPARPPAPEPQYAEPLPDPEPNPGGTTRALTNALESLGMAHHRPFSRS